MVRSHDLRGIPRFPVQTQGMILDLLPFTAPVLNMSRYGLRVASTQGLLVGYHYPAQIRHGRQAVDLVASVRWCSLETTVTDPDGEVVPVYCAGLAVVSIERQQDGGLLGRLRVHPDLAGALTGGEPTHRGRGRGRRSPQSQSM